MLLRSRCEAGRPKSSSPRRKKLPANGRAKDRYKLAGSVASAKASKSPKTGMIKHARKTTDLTSKDEGLSGHFIAIAAKKIRRRTIVTQGGTSERARKTTELTGKVRTQLPTA